jgi:hypothetical protein
MAHPSETPITVTEDSIPPPPPVPTIATSDGNTTTRGVEAATDERTSDAQEIPGVGRRIPKLALLAGGLGVVVLVAVVALTLKLASGRDGETAASASATVPSSAVTVAARGAAPAAATASAEPAKADEVAPAQFLALSTNAPVAEVRVGDRVVDMVIAAPNVNVELEPEETQRALVITLRSADGRIATKTLARGELEAKIAFGTSRGPAPAAPRPPPPTRKPPRR